ncbi:MAG: exodeoxyribonuclease V subunit gamma [Pseudomonadota bacterium]|nr:exodeoxyribonuclease V subunit gamma [Pseudomonadota bacterium]
MLRLISSNDLSELTRIFCSEAINTDGDPFAPATILVQSYGTGQWLKLQVAKQLGIAANLECLLPAHFIWRLYQKLLDQPNLAPLQDDLLAFRLMAILGKSTEPAIAGYLSQPGDQDLRYYQLAKQLAQVFEQYLMYRPDWILAWQQGNDPVPSNPQSWQARLWQSLIKREPGLAEVHRAALHQRLMETLEFSEKSKHLPQRLSIFGLASLAPLQLETFRRLAELIPVDIYFMNPCQHYWGDIVSTKIKSHRSIQQLLSQSPAEHHNDYSHVGNPLLASMGQQGREFLELLLEQDETQTVESFLEHHPDTALGQLQADILDLTFGGEFDIDPKPETRTLNSDDQSIQFHSSHSKSREVEILLDQILEIVSTSDTKPSEIIVMAPDIDEYVPLIRASFTGKIPFGIADQSAKNQSTVLSSIVTLLALGHSRLTSIEIMGLLEVPAIARKFGIKPSDIDQLEAWISETGIRWEWDGDTKAANWNVPGTDQNTWLFGIQRMLMGLMIGQEQGLYEQHMPYDMTSGDIPLLEKMLALLNQLTQLRKRLKQAKTARQWQQLLNQMLRDFYLCRDAEGLDLDHIKSSLTKLVDDMDTCQFNQPVSLKLMSYWIQKKIEESASSMRFIAGGITFATLVPMRSIPFRMVCLIGMNDGEYPRKKAISPFDLIARTPYRKGDQSRRQDDRYLFLEALLSARQQLYISYQGRNIRDNKLCPASVLVGELRDYCSSVFSPIPVIDHPLQPFSTRYYQDENLPTFAQEWYAGLTSVKGTRAFIDSKPLTLPENDLASLQELVQFYRHPGRYFMKQRLNVSLDPYTTALSESESFSQDPLDKYLLTQSALTALLKGVSENTWAAEQIASGTIMDNAAGHSLARSNLSQAKMLLEEINPYLDEDLKPYQAIIELDEVSLSGEVSLVGDRHRLYFRAGLLAKRHLLGPWIEHVFLHASGYQQQSIIIGRERSDVQQGRFTAIKQTHARTILQRLTKRYRQGNRSPLLLPADTLYSLYANYQSSGDLDQAVEKAMAKWSHEMGGDGTDPYWQRLMRVPEDLNQQALTLAQEIFQPLDTHWVDSDVDQ